MSRSLVQEEFFNTLIDFGQIKPILYGDSKYEWSEIEYLINNNLNDDMSISIASPCSSHEELPDLMDPYDDQSEFCFPSSSNQSPMPSTPAESLVSQTHTLSSTTSSEAKSSPPKRKPASKEKCSKKTFHCETCHRYFARRHDLERHSRIHTGIKPYICICCQKSFSRSDARNRHFRSDPICSLDERVKQPQRTKRKL